MCRRGPFYYVVSSSPNKRPRIHISLLPMQCISGNPCARGFAEPWLFRHIIFPSSFHISHICAQHTHLSMSFASIINIQRKIHSRFLCSVPLSIFVRLSCFYVSVIIQIMSLILGSCNCFSHANYFAFFSLEIVGNRRLTR